jgi:hypothetical protein
MSDVTRFHPEQAVETLRVSQSLSYNWEYDTTRARLMRLYENAKRDQWDGATRLDWSIDVDPEKGLVPDMGIGIWGTPIWDRLTVKEKAKLRHEAITWQLCQFLHGEQGALLATAQIVDAVPWYEAKQYGATQVMDEARHVEVFGKYLDKLGHDAPLNPALEELVHRLLDSDHYGDSADTKPGRSFKSTTPLGAKSPQRQFVLPPMAILTMKAFRMASLVMMSLGRKLAFRTAITRRPAW